MNLKLLNVLYVSLAFVERFLLEIHQIIEISTNSSEKKNFIVFFCFDFDGGVLFKKM
jgi:hypothetical protein